MYPSRNCRTDDSESMSPDKPRNLEDAQDGVYSILKIVSLADYAPRGELYRIEYFSSGEQEKWQEQSGLPEAERVNLAAHQQALQDSIDPSAAILALNSGTAKVSPHLYSVVYMGRSS
jgi:hypothetical protein